MSDIPEETLKYTKKIDTLELQVCPELKKKKYLKGLADTLQNIRNKIFDIYGVPLPPIKITCCDSVFSNPEVQIKILITGCCVKEIKRKEKDFNIPEIIYNCVKHNLSQCITSSTIEKIYEEVQKDNQMLITNLRSFTDSFAAVEFVLRELVSQLIPINNIVQILETILDCYARYRIDDSSYWHLIHKTRMNLAPFFVTTLLNAKREFFYFDISEEIKNYLELQSSEDFKKEFLTSLRDEIEKILKENPEIVFVLNMTEVERNKYCHILHPYFPDLVIITREELENADYYSPFTKKLIKTIDIPTPKKEKPKENTEEKKKTPWIKKIFKKQILFIFS